MSTLTESSQIAETYSRNKNLQDNIKYVAGDQGIDIHKIRQYTNNLLDQGIPQDQVVKMIIEANKQGMFKPDQPVG